MGIFLILLVGVFFVNQPTVEPLTGETKIEVTELVESTIPVAYGAINDEPTEVEAEESWEKPANSVPNLWENPAKNETQASATVMAEFVPVQSDHSNRPTYKYNYVGDFERDFKGYCAKDVPAGMWVDELHPAVALGYLGFTDQDTSPEGKIRHVWGTFKLQNFYEFYGDYYIVDWSSSYGIDTGGVFNGSIADTNVAFVLHWSTKTITWEPLWKDSPAKDYWSAEIQNQLDAITKRMTDHLHYLDSAYTAKCGS